MSPTSIFFSAALETFALLESHEAHSYDRGIGHPLVLFVQSLHRCKPYTARPRMTLERMLCL